MLTWEALKMIDIISIHIPKTAGSSFRNVLSQVYGNDLIFWDYSDSNHEYNLGSELPENTQVIHGHFPAKKYNGHFPKAKRIVWLRHPIFRLVSEYFYAQKYVNRDNPNHVQLVDNNLSLLEFAHIEDLRNLLSKYLEGMQLEDFYFVGIQEFYDADLAELKQLLQWSNFKAIVKNPNPDPNYLEYLKEIFANQKLVDRLIELNLQDMEVYQGALNLRAARRRESSWLQDISAHWNRSVFLQNNLRRNTEKLEMQLKQANFWLSQNKTKVKSLDIVKYSQKDTSDFLHGFSLDQVKSPEENDSDYLFVNGWVIGKKSPAVSVIFTCNDEVLSETPVKNYRPDVSEVFPVPGASYSGFQAYISVVGMSSELKLQIQAVLEDNSKVSLGYIQPINC